MPVAADVMPPDLIQPRNRPTDILMGFKSLALAADLTANEKSVGAALLDHCNRSTGQCDPSQMTLAQTLGLSQRTITRSIEGLVAKKYFRKSQHGGKFHRNSYEPFWSLYHSRDKAWSDRRHAVRAPKLSSLGVRKCQSDPVKNVTQTYPIILSRESFGAQVPVSSPSTEPPGVYEAIARQGKIGCSAHERQTALPNSGCSMNTLEIEEVRQKVSSCLAMLERRLGRASFVSWFGALKLISFDGNQIIFMAPNGVVRTRISNWYENDVRQCFGTQFPGVRVKIEVRRTEK